MPELTLKEQRVAALLLEGCHNAEIAKDMKIPVRTVKAAMSRMFQKYGIESGIRRVKLAVILYREQQTKEKSNA